MLLSLSPLNCPRQLPLHHLQHLSASSLFLLSPLSLPSHGLSLSSLSPHISAPASFLITHSSLPLPVASALSHLAATLVSLAFSLLPSSCLATAQLAATQPSLSSLSRRCFCSRLPLSLSQLLCHLLHFQPLSQLSHSLLSLLPSSLVSLLPLSQPLLSSQNPHCLSLQLPSPSSLLHAACLMHVQHLFPVSCCLSSTTFPSALHHHTNCLSAARQLPSLSRSLSQPQLSANLLLSLNSLCSLSTALKLLPPLSLPSATSFSRATISLASLLSPSALLLLALSLIAFCPHLNFSAISQASALFTVHCLSSLLFQPPFFSSLCPTQLHTFSF